ncbi:Na/Pi cotransporter family protein [Aureimonas fodinaquatilis]|uniref:Na/Pi cotransporter family protein n=1 Tax=Aureimonas fodinaquatilis TaxID=2565783 RepID=A0A5B0DYH9_9HYPH|nr:Na/Pi cotransporter family protein [Aureimonas fodinaquatilis]KAA0971844.1 Na/Pi cotransporter family protein [Aureimonas fodinaquatilis]
MAPSGTFVLLELLGGIALLLWGVRMVRTGIIRAFGERLNSFLEQRLDGRFKAFSGGLVATAILGSSTAMALIVAGLASSGALNALTGLTLLLGADVGSALVAGVFAAGSSLASELAPVLIASGYLVFSLSREFRPRNLGRVILGLGLMFLALRMVIGATSPLRDATLFHQSLEAVASEPFLALLIGAILAWMFHSTLAVVLLITSFLVSGSLEPAYVLPFILGLNLGGGLPAVAATFDQPAVARRLPLANLFCRGSLALVCFVALKPIGWLVAMVAVPPAYAAISLHVGFNLLAAAIFLPFAPLVIRFVETLVPDVTNESSRFGAPRYLDRDALSSPDAALANAAVETLRMGEILERMLSTVLAALESKKLEPLKEIPQLDATLGAYMKSVHKYIGRIYDGDLAQSEAQRVFAITLCASNLEHAGDVIKLNLAARMKSRIKSGIEFSDDELEQLQDLSAVVYASLRLLPAALSTSDVKASARLAAQKDKFREIEQAIVQQHLVETLGRKRTARGSALFVDLIRDLHRINSHIASAGYPVVAAAGLLNGSRLSDW